MFDAFNLPWPTRADVQTFTRPSAVTNTQWMTWLKPRGTAMVHIVCIGGGGGGGGGFTAAAAAARGGGGSGGSSAVSRVTIPSLYLPDRLYVQVGAGGIGQVSGGGVAGSGVLSYVAVAPDTTISNVIIVSCTSPATGGGTGTGAAPGAAGVAGTIAAIANMPLCGMGQFAFIAGQIGVIGGAVAGAVGTAITIPTTSVLCQAGSSGAGTTSADFAGGLFTATVPSSYLSEQRPATPPAGTTGHGSGGPQLWQPFFSFGGGGGSSSNAAAGGNGGHGAHGAGGGGGGGGTTGGRGGNGGGGVVIVISW